jgi:putative NADH-flavin reductase
VQHLASGFDASISALASAKGNLVCAQLAEALRNTTDLRFITIGGAGVDDLGDDKGFADKAVGWVMRRIVPEMLQDRQTELAILKKSALRWTMLRPGRLTDKAGGDTISLTYDRPATSAIARADLAKVAVNTLTDDLLVNKAPFVAEKKK